MPRKKASKKCIICDTERYERFSPKVFNKCMTCRKVENKLLDHAVFSMVAHNHRLAAKYWTPRPLYDLDNDMDE